MRDFKRKRDRHKESREKKSKVSRKKTSRWEKEWEHEGKKKARKKEQGERERGAVNKRRSLSHCCVFVLYWLSRPRSLAGVTLFLSVMLGGRRERGREKEHIAQGQSETNSLVKQILFHSSSNRVIAP